MVNTHHKGRRGENELATILTEHGYPAERISAPYKQGPDLEAFNGRTVEVKRRAKLPATLKKWTRDAQVVAIREDYDAEWWVFLSLNELCDLLDEYGAHPYGR